MDNLYKIIMNNDQYQLQMRETGQEKFKQITEQTPSLYTVLQSLLQQKEPGYCTAGPNVPYAITAEARAINGLRNGNDITRRVAKVRTELTRFAEDPIGTIKAWHQAAQKKEEKKNDS